MKPAKTKTIDRADREAAKALGPLCKYAADHKGSYKEITQRLSKLMGQPVARQLVEAWLRPDPAKRVHPRYGVGVLLVRIWHQLETENQKPTTANPGTPRHGTATHPAGAACP